MACPGSRAVRPDFAKRPFQQTTCNRALKRFAERYNAEALSVDADARLLPHIHCPMLRHTYANALMEAKVGKNVAREMMDHVSDDMLNMIYQDVQKDLAEEMSKLSALL